MKIKEKYEQFISSPDMLNYIGESKIRKNLVRFITSFVIVILLIIAIILISVLIKVFSDYIFR